MDSGTFYGFYWCEGAILKKHAVLFTDKAAQYAKSRMDKKNLGFF